MHVPIYTQNSDTVKCLCGWQGQLDPDMPRCEAAYLAFHAGHRQQSKDYTLMLSFELAHDYTTPCALCSTQDRCVRLEAGYEAEWLICGECAQKCHIDLHSIA